MPSHCLSVVESTTIVYWPQNPEYTPTSVKNLYLCQEYV
jgi:hypothetical protein